MYWLTAIAVVAVFNLWVFAPDVAGALWATIATLAACWLALELVQ